MTLSTVCLARSQYSLCSLTRKIIYDDDEAVSMIGTCWDISERKRLDKAKF